MDHSVEKREIYSQKKKKEKRIPSNQLSSKTFSKNVDFTNFIKKSGKVFFRNFHTVSMILPHGNYKKILSHFFGQKFREINVLTKCVTKELV